MRPVWTGSLTFGLVNIPVKLMTAVRDSSLSFDMLDSKDFSRIRYKRVSESSGKEVPFERIIKAYDLNGKYVALEKQDFELADVQRSKTIDLDHFVNVAEIGSIYYEQPYYMVPDKGSEKAYALLREILTTTGKAGVASFVMRTKETLAVVIPFGKFLMLNRIRFEEEIVEPEELGFKPEAKVSPKEKSVAGKLIEEMTREFDISEYKDQYSKKLLDLIKKKSKGQKITPPKLKVVHKTEEDELMEMLQASLGKKKKRA